MLRGESTARAVEKGKLDEADRAGILDAVTFTADVKGVFEIETHESAKLVAKLMVS